MKSRGWRGGGGIAVREGQIQLPKLRTNCRKIAAPLPNPPKPQGATLLHRGHAGHQQAGKVDKQKPIKLRKMRKLRKLPENSGKLRKIARLRKIADLNPPPPCEESWHCAVSNSICSPAARRADGCWFTEGWDV